MMWRGFREWGDIRLVTIRASLLGAPRHEPHQFNRAFHIYDICFSFYLFFTPHLLTWLHHAEPDAILDTYRKHSLTRGFIC
jgi:hypothetical protein